MSLFADQNRFGWRRIRDGRPLRGLWCHFKTAANELSSVGAGRRRCARQLYANRHGRQWSSTVPKSSRLHIGWCADWILQGRAVGWRADASLAGRWVDWRADRLGRPVRGRLHDGYDVLPGGGCTDEFRSGWTRRCRGRLVQHRYIPMYNVCDTRYCYTISNGKSSAKTINCTPSYNNILYWSWWHAHCADNVKPGKSKL